MKKSILHELSVDLMRPRVEAFLQDVGTLDTSGIPEPHLPHWGVLYESATPKIGIIGCDTRGWGEMPQFLEAVRRDPDTAIFRGSEEFDLLKFTNWTNNFGKSFWDTSMRILAEMHGIADWKSLKRREIIAPLQSFFWANANSVEGYEVSAKKNGVSKDIWWEVKKSSERHLDSFRTVLDLFRPDIVFLMKWDPGNQFLDFPLKWKEFGDHQAEATDSKTGCLILATAHPTWLNHKRIYEEVISGVIQKAKESRYWMSLRGG